MKTSLFCRAAAGAVAVAVSSMPVMAQGAADGVKDDVIIVTAQKREQDIVDVPLSVNVISGDELRDQQISSMEDIAQIAPSVTFSPSTNPLNASINIRGVGTKVFSAAVEPSVSFVIDGVVMSRQGQSFMDLIDIERVEILRGPQSTLFGKNASAGVISVTTKKPSETFEGTAELLVAEGDEYQLSGTVSGPISDKVRARLTGYYKDIGGHIDNIYDGRDLNGHKSYGLRGKVLFEPTDRLEVELIGDWRKSNDECCIWQHRRVDDPLLLAAISPIVPGPTNDQVNLDADVRNRTESWGLQANVKYEFDNAELTSITAYRKWDFSNTSDIDGTPSNNPNVLTAYQGGLFGLDINDNDQTLKQFSQEIRIASSNDGPFNYVLGAYYSSLDYGGNFSRRLCFLNVGSDDCPATVRVFFTPTFSRLLPGARSHVFYSDVNSSNFAVFGQADYEVSDRLTVTGGLRVLRDHTAFVYSQAYAGIVATDQPSPFPAPAGQVDGPDNPLRSGSGSVTDWAMTGKAAIQYRIADRANVYASYTRGYKGPTVDLAPNAAVNEIKPETSNAFELGLKGVFADGLLALDLALFNVDYKNYQGQVFDPELGGIRINNAGKIRTRGAELELVLRPADGLKLAAGTAYTDAKIRKYGLGPCYGPIAQDPDCDVTTGLKPYEGLRLSGTPKWSFNFNGRYDLLLPESVPFDMFVTGSYQWQGDVQFQQGGSPETVQKGYGIANASLGFTDKDKHITATFFVKNLFDKHFVGLLFPDPLRTNGFNIDQFITKNANRYFGGSVRVSF